jgi:hypothetical protein
MASSESELAELHSHPSSTALATVWDTLSTAATSTPNDNPLDMMMPVRSG